MNRLPVARRVTRLAAVVGEPGGGVTVARSSVASAIVCVGSAATSVEVDVANAVGSAAGAKEGRLHPTIMMLNAMMTDDPALLARILRGPMGRLLFGWPG